MSGEIPEQRTFFESRLSSGKKAAKFIVEAADGQLAEKRAIEYCIENRFIGPFVGGAETTALDLDEQERQNIVAPFSTDIRLMELSQPENPPVPPIGKYRSPDQWPPPPPKAVKTIPLQ